MEIPHEVLAEEGIKTEWGIVPVADKEGRKWLGRPQIAKETRVQITDTSLCLLLLLSMSAIISGISVLCDV